MPELIDHCPIVPGYEFLGTGRYGKDTAAYYTLDVWSESVDQNTDEFQHGFNESGSLHLVRRRSEPDRLYWWRISSGAKLMVLVQPYFGKFLDETGEPYEENAT